MPFLWQIRKRRFWKRLFFFFGFFPPLFRLLLGSFPPPPHTLLSVSFLLLFFCREAHKVVGPTTFSPLFSRPRFFFCFLPGVDQIVSATFLEPKHRTKKLWPPRSNRLAIRSCYRPQTSTSVGLGCSAASGPSLLPRSNLLPRLRNLPEPRPRNGNATATSLGRRPTPPKSSHPLHTRKEPLQAAPLLTCRPGRLTLGSAPRPLGHRPRARCSCPCRRPRTRG